MSDSLIWTLLGHLVCIAQWAAFILVDYAYLGRGRRFRHPCVWAALLALATYSELKNIILVDEDVDIFDSDDILWAMTTRMQGDVSITTIPGIRGHQLDPSQTPEYSPSIRGNGISCKTIFDCTVPWALKSHFERAPFADVDPRPFAPEYFARLEKNQGSAK